MEKESLYDKSETITEFDLICVQLKRINDKYPELLQGPFMDWIYVLVQSAESGKYPLNNWLEPEGRGCDKKSMYGSTFRHIADGYVGIPVDKDSGLDPRLHAVCRLMMDYTRSKYGIVHPNDKTTEVPDLDSSFFSCNTKHSCL